MTAQTLPAPSITRGARIRQRFLAHRAAMLSLTVLVVMGLAAAIMPWFFDHWGIDPFETDLFNFLGPPDARHPLGTDEAGRDVLARLILGGQVSLTFGMVTAVTSAILGTVIGITAGYFGGRLDAFLMRLTDGVISLPLLPLLIILSALDFEKIGLGVLAEESGVGRMVGIISLVAWPTVARIVRAETLSLKSREYILAAKAQGAGPFYIMRHHILPNVQSSIVVATTLSVGNIILLESVLSFLGLGIQLPTPSWGNMLTNAQNFMFSVPELAMWPGLAIFVAVIAFNFLGDGLQDALDPRHAGR